jgi:SnoaL-like protein
VSDDAGIARLLWERIQARDWDGARALLADDMVCRWPHSDERFEGADNFIQMNRAYPEGWEITVVDVTAIPGGAVSRIRVDETGARFHAASFLRSAPHMAHSCAPSGTRSVHSGQRSGSGSASCLLRNSPT